MIKTKKILRENQESIILRNIRKDFFGIILVIVNGKPEGQILFINNKWNYIRNVDASDSIIRHDKLSDLLDFLEDYCSYSKVKFEVIEYGN